MNLDGNDKIKPTPFDTHEQVVRGPHVVEHHVYSPEEFDDQDRGHLAVEYEHQEYPKHVVVGQDETTGESLTVIAQDAEHEYELTKGKE